MSSFVGLQHALLLPTLCVLLAAVFCIPAMRHVGPDMRAREDRAFAVREAAAKKDATAAFS